MSNQVPNTSLMQAIKFTPEDLEANRNSKVTEPQRAKLKTTTGITRGATLFMFGLFIVIIIAIGGYFFFFTDSGKVFMKPGPDGTSMAPIIIGVIAAVVVIIFLSSLRTLMRTNEMAKEKVSVTEGVAKLKSYYARYGMYSYQVKVGKVNFHVQEAAYRGFVQGQSYRLFYIKMPPTNIILSGEQI